MDEQDGEDEPMEETSPKSLNAKIDALMERLDAIEAKMGMNDDESDDEEDDDMEEED